MNLENKTLVYFENEITPTFGKTDIFQLSKFVKKMILFTNDKNIVDAEFPDNVVVKRDYIQWSKMNWLQLTLKYSPVFFIAIIREWVSGKLVFRQLSGAVKKLITTDFFFGIYSVPYFGDPLKECDQL